VRFEDVSRAAGIVFRHERAASSEKLYLETMGAGVGWIDYDQDGFLDAFFANSGATPHFQPARPPQPALYRNNGDGTFTDVTAKSGLAVGPGFFFFGVAAGDYDNDGYPDLYVSGYRRSLLYRNNGKGGFEDVTDKAGVGDRGDWATAAGWFDYDRDGRLDLLVANYVKYDMDHNVVCGDPTPAKRAYCHPDSFPGTPARLYRNNGGYQSFATQMAQQPPLSETFNATSTLQTPLTLANGFIAPISTTLNTVAIDPEFRVGTVHRWQASAQRDLPGAFTVTGTYQGGKGVNLPQAFIPNTYPAGVINPCAACPTGFIYTTSHGRSRRAPASTVACTIVIGVYVEPGPFVAPTSPAITLTRAPASAEVARPTWPLRMSW